MTSTALILGPSGRFGRHAAEAFWNAGWQVRLFDRKTDDLTTAADGADVIVNGWNPKYSDWEKELPRLTRQVIKAARSSGATVLLPGNLYVYGKGSPPHLGLQTPHLATNTLGRLRIETEQAYRASGVQTILLRAGDFIDTTASGNWFDMIIAKKAHAGKLVAPGDPRAAHAWAFLPDLAQAAVQLVEKRDQLAPFDEVLFPGYTLSVQEMADIASACLNQKVSVSQFHWWPILAAAPFWKMGRHLLEMRYLWSMPHWLDPAPFNTVLPDFKPTDPAIALATALRGLQKIGPDKPVTRGAQNILTE